MYFQRYRSAATRRSQRQLYGRFSLACRFRSFLKRRRTCSAYPQNIMILQILLLFCSCALIHSSESESFIVSVNDANDESDEFIPGTLVQRSPLEDEIFTNFTNYDPTWKSLDSRPIPSWYDRAKIGIFIHWGVFSVPSFGSEWFWHNWKTMNMSKYQEFMKKRYPPDFTYQDFARDFTAEFFDAKQWSELFKAAGAKYIVLTSKHHEGFTLWPSRYSFSWNAGDVGPNRDLIGELASAVRSTQGMKFGLYHSMYEWYNPMWLYDVKNHFTTDNFVTQKVIPELHELVETYRPEVIWSDGDWEASDTYWKSKEFIAWLYNKSPVKDTVVVNDRWGSNIPCHHGDFYTCTDRYNPGKLQTHKWENCMTIDKNSWGFRRNAVLSDYLTVKELIKELVTTVSCGGNLLINVGPTKDGMIAPIFEDRLRGLGAWLKVNGEAIYNSKPWAVQNDTLNGDVWYTQSENNKTIYSIFLEWPKDNILKLGAIQLPSSTRIYLLPKSTQLKWYQDNKIVMIRLPENANEGQSAWTLSFQNP